ncbi:phosphoribosylglycinamide formyltransferase [Burkholderiales bacterium]|nr:phosphoribosylglycinamide formyltransferase [Burkholderiales bacterium]
MKKIVILISGRGSNMQAIINAQMPYNICCVISNNPNAQGLDFAKKNGIDTCVVNHLDYPDRKSFDQALGNVVEKYEPDLIVLAGFMRILNSDTIARFSEKIINIHPSLLPAFTGLDTHARAIDAGVKIHGCTVHFVSPDLDSGPIVAQAALRIRSNDSPQTLADRILTLEHEILPKSITWILDGRCTMSSGRIIMDSTIFNDTFSFHG